MALHHCCRAFPEPRSDPSSPGSRPGCHANTSIRDRLWAHRPDQPEQRPGMCEDDHRRPVGLECQPESAAEKLNQCHQQHRHHRAPEPAPEPTCRQRRSRGDASTPSAGARNAHAAGYARQFLHGAGRRSLRRSDPSTIRRLFSNGRALLPALRGQQRSDSRPLLTVKTRCRCCVVTSPPRQPSNGE